MSHILVRLSLPKKLWNCVSSYSRSWGPKHQFLISTLDTGSLNETTRAAMAAEDLIQSSANSRGGWLVKKFFAKSNTSTLTVDNLSLPTTATNTWVTGVAACRKRSSEVVQLQVVLGEGSGGISSQDRSIYITPAEINNWFGESKSTWNFAIWSLTWQWLKLDL